MAPNRCLITGGAGFIGSHLAEYLLSRGDTVHVIDDLSTGSMRNIEHLKSNSRFSYTIDTCENRALMAELVDSAEEVYHLAAAVGVRLVVDDPVRTIHLNYGLTEILLETACKKRRPVLMASTSEVYGKGQQMPFKEDDDVTLGATTRWRWAYACSKMIDEFMCLACYRKRGLPIVIVRLFNTVGPRQTGRYGMVVPRFVQQAMENKDITVYGDGQQTRCFCHVADTVPAMVKLLRGQKAHGEVVNLGATEEIKIMDLAVLVRKLVNPKVGIVTVPYEEAYDKGFEDMRRRVPSIDKARRLVQFEPKRSIETIIRDVHNHFKDMKRIYGRVSSVTTDN